MAWRDAFNPDVPDHGRGTSRTQLADKLDLAVDRLPQTVKGCAGPLLEIVADRSLSDTQLQGQAIGWLEQLRTANLELLQRQRELEAASKSGDERLGELSAAYMREGGHFDVAMRRMGEIATAIGAAGRSGREELDLVPSVTLTRMVANSGALLETTQKLQQLKSGAMEYMQSRML